MLDPFAGVFARGRRTAAVVEGEVLDPTAPELSRPKRAVLAAMDEALALIGGASLPIPMRAMVGMLQSSSGLARNAVAGMDEAQVRGVLETIGARITDALADDAA